ncbi:MAG: hypothetical protein R3D29_16005 [Nitratireductor sp.]
MGAAVFSAYAEVINKRDDNNHSYARIVSHIDPRRRVPIPAMT